MKPETVLSVLAGLGVGMTVVLCLGLLNPFVLFAGFLLVVPVGLCMLAMVPIVSSPPLSGLTMRMAVVGGVIFAAIMAGLPIVAATVEGRLRAPPLPVPEDAQMVRSENFAGDARVFYTVDDPPGGAAEHTARAAAEAGWQPGVETSHGRFYDRGGEQMFVDIKGTDGGTVVMLYQQHLAITPILLLLLTGIGYAGALIYALTHPARQER